MVELDESRGLKEQLRYHEISSCVHFLFQMEDVFIVVRTVGVTMGIPWSYRELRNCSWSTLIWFEKHNFLAKSPKIHSGSVKKPSRNETTKEGKAKKKRVERTETTQYMCHTKGQRQG